MFLTDKYSLISINIWQFEVTITIAFLKKRHVHENNAEMQKILSFVGGQY